MSQLLPQYNLSDIRYGILLSYLTDDDGYKAYTNSKRRVMSLKKSDDKKSLSSAEGFYSLIVDSIAISSMKFN